MAIKNYQIVQSHERDQLLLAELRLVAMRASLEAIGRFDPDRARARFLDSFEAHNTWLIKIGKTIAGFYVVKTRAKYILLDHLYIHPNFQGQGLGSEIIATLKIQSKQSNFVIQVTALRDSDSNQFYQKHGFSQVDEQQWDIHYQFVDR